MKFEFPKVLNLFRGHAGRGASRLWRYVGLGQWTPLRSGRRYDQINRDALLSLSPERVNVRIGQNLIASGERTKSIRVHPCSSVAKLGVLGVLAVSLLRGCEPAYPQEVRGSEFRVSSFEIRLAALSQIESGDNDKAIGKDGEVSRYQILPSIWKQETNQNYCIQTPNFPMKCFYDFSFTNSEDAAQVVSDIQTHREDKAFWRHGKLASDFEWYLLWHRPACLMANRKITARESERAQRFANLCEKLATDETRNKHRAESLKICVHSVAK